MACATCLPGCRNITWCILEWWSAIRPCTAIPRWAKGEVTKSQPKQAFHPHSRLYSKRAEQCCEEGPWSWNRCCHVRWLWRDPPQWELWSLKHISCTGRGQGQTRPPKVGLVEAEWWAHEGLLYNYFYVCIQLESSTIKSIIQKKIERGKTHFQDTQKQKQVSSTT